MVRSDDDLAWSPAVATWQLAVRVPTTSEAVAIVAQLADLTPRTVALVGERLLARRDLPDLLAEGAGRGLRTTVAVPRPCPDAATIARLAAAGAHGVGLDADAATPAAVGAARDAGLHVELGTTLVRHAVEHLPRTAAAVAELAPDLWRVPFFVPGAPAERTRELGPDACERAYAFLAEWSDGAGIPVETEAAPAYRRVLAQRRAAGPRPLPLNDGKGLVCVTPGGDVRPSPFLPLSTANVRDTPLADVYRRSRLFRALRDGRRLGGRCGRCGFRALCGGSRARAYAATGDFLAADPACAWPVRAPFRA